MKDRDRFLDQVEECADSLSPEELVWCINETARILPEELWERYLTVLRMGERPSFKGFHPEKKTLRELKKELSRAQKLLRDIKDRKRVIWMGFSGGWFLGGGELTYSDPDGVMQGVTEAIWLVHRLVDAGEYKSARKLGLDLLSLDITVKGVFGKETLCLAEAYKALKMDLPGDIKKLALETMFCAYRCPPSPMEDIYQVLTGSSSSDLCFNDLYDFADGDLEDLPRFFPAWIDYLGNRKDQQSNRLYAEALDLFPDDEERMEKVKAHAGIHPEAYLPVMRDPQLSLPDRFHLGMDGLDRLDVHCPVREEIALETAKLSLLTSQAADVTESCQVEAFASSPTPINYLRVLLNCHDQKNRKDKEEMRKLYDSLYASGKTLPDEERDDSALLFLMGDFMKVFRTSLQPGDYQEWQRPFARGGTALYLAVLYRGSTPTPSLQAMMDKACSCLGFDEDAYRQGLTVSNSRDDRYRFPVVFEEWKKTVVLPDAQETEEILSGMEKSLEILVAGVCAENERSAYGECADYLGALGDVRESLGQTGEKQRILTACAQAYPRRRNLIARLQEVGWNG